MKVCIFSPTSSITGRTRLYKISKIITDLGGCVEHYAWRRSKADSVAESNLIKIVKQKHILSGGGYGGGGNKPLYLVWMIKVFFRLLVMRKSNVWALGLETAFPAVLASCIRGHRVVFDDADRLVLLFKLPSAVFRVVRSLEIFTSKRSIVHIIPSAERYDYFSPKFLELTNLPSRGSVLKALEAKIDDDVMRFVNGKTVVYANGWLSETRGAEFIVDLCRRILEKNLQSNVCVIVAGRIDSCEIKECLRLPFVMDLGLLEYEEALALYKVSDYVLTLYDPSVAINKYAISNKWGDCLFFKVRPVINRGVETARALESVSVKVEYDSAELLLADMNNSAGKLLDSRLFDNLLGKLVPFEEGIQTALSKFQ